MIVSNARRRQEIPLTNLWWTGTLSSFDLIITPKSSSFQSVQTHDRIREWDQSCIEDAVRSEISEWCKDWNVVKILHPLVTNIRWPLAACLWCKHLIARSFCKRCASNYTLCNASVCTEILSICCYSLKRPLYIKCLFRYDIDNIVDINYSASRLTHPFFISSQ